MSWWRSKRPTGIAYGASSHVGLVRSENQDAYGCFPEQNIDEAEERLFIVADGMGGHQGGKEASRIALAEVPRVFFETSEKPITDRLKAAFEKANDRILAKAQQGNGFDRMGTTCTALVVAGGDIFIAHVGDTRAYRVDDAEEIELLTADHTLVEEMRREGVLTEAEAKTHPRRNTLTRAMGVEPNLNVDVYDIGSLKSDQRFILCSDGLSEVTREELKRVVSNLAPQLASDRLVEMANERGGHDNVTVLVLQVL